MSETAYSWIALGLGLLFAVLLFVHATFGMKKREFNYARLAARAAVFGAISTILYIVPIFNFNLPFLPSFLALHFEEIPAFIAGYAYGPFTAFVVILMKTLIKLPMTNTLGVGELTDFILNIAFILPATLIYKKWRNFKGVFLGFGLSFLIQNVVALFLNVYAMIPFYIFMMGYPEDALLAMCQAVNANVTDLKWSYAFLCVLPLNVIKDSLVLLLVFFIYKVLHKPLRFEAAK